MELPHALRAAIEEELTALPPATVARLSEGLSARYRGEERRGQSLLTGPGDAAAYAVTRLPATHGAIGAALAAAGDALPGWTPATVLDVGAGPGTAAWAAASRWPAVSQVTHLEREPAMIALGQRLEQRAAAPWQARWLIADATGPWEVPPHDLTLCCYMLGEVAAEKRAALVERLWQATAGLLVLVEPGTPAGFAVVRAARTQLLALGAPMAAPCPGPVPCPMEGDNWCHFSQRVARTRLHRQAKGGELAYEDEKYSYVAFTRLPAQPTPARVLRHPLVRKGHLQLTLCTAQGEKNTTVTRSQGERYRAAKDLRWGDGFGWQEEE